MERMNKRNLVFVLAFLLVAAALLAVGTRPAAAQQPQPTPNDDAVNAVAKQMYCPVCENIPLDVCPTQACHDWRELIRQKLAQGWDAQQIKTYFAAQYGDRVLNEPPTRGLNWLVYALPPLGFLIGAVIVGSVLVRMRKSPAERAQAQAALSSDKDDPYMARLEAELKQKEKQ